MPQPSPIIQKLETLRVNDSDIRTASNLDTLALANIISALPKWFPVPDDFYTKATGHFEGDLTLRYYMHEGERAEPLRLLLSMVFGISEWYGILEKEDGVFALRASVRIKGVHFLLIIEADQDDYEYTPLQDKGMYTTGPVTSKKFVPYDILRNDITPAVFQSLQLENGLQGTMLTWWLDLLTRLITGIPKDTPVPEYIQDAFTEDHDVDFLYTDDSYGQIRKQIDSLYPGAKWYLNWNKQEGTGFLCTVVSVPETPGIMIKVTLELPCLDEELLLLLEDDEECLYYRAVQATEKDFEEILGQKYERLE